MASIKVCRVKLIQSLEAALKKAVAHRLTYSVLPSAAGRMRSPIGQSGPDSQ